MRGKAVHHKHRHSPGRITPAYAEKRIKLRKRHSICGDHPRMCGEKLVTEFITRYMMGSPLRVRGKVGPVIQLRAGPGITPACAGKRAVPYLRRWYARDHPRVCGEKYISTLWPSLSVGSPPRVRGKVTGNLYAGRHLRITPAYAGKSTYPRSGRLSAWDHPRVCGEKSLGISTPVAT